jgi:hypothetical protein
VVQGVTAAKLRDIARREHAVALEEYCASLVGIANALARSVPPRPEQLERTQAASLRLESARTLIQLSMELMTGEIAAAGET